MKTITEIRNLILQGGGMYKEKIPVPSSQTGTLTQMRAYAQMTAKRIYEKNKEYLNTLVD